MPTRAAGHAADPTPPLDRAATRRVMRALGEQYPDADTELHFSNAYELLVATILSAQCTDARVNQVTPALFRRYPDARALARATTDELEPQIQSTGFFRAKSRSLVGMATALVDAHGGEVPATMDALVALPGVGRKTANVVLGHALGIPGLPVDRHVLRVANRLGIAASDDPEIVERQLCAALPRAEWTRASDTLILHGRRICKPKPLCDRCNARDECLYYRHVVAQEDRRPPAAGHRTSSGTPSLPAKAGSHGNAPQGGQSSQPRRAAKPRGTRRGGEAPPGVAAESGQSPNERRGAKRRGTGRGGEAPPGVAAQSGQSPNERRGAKRRGTGRGSEAPHGAAAQSGQSPNERRGAKRRGTGRGGEAPPGVAAQSGQSPNERRGAKRRGTGRGGEAPPGVAAESGQSPNERRGAKRRGTGRGGGAPRRTDK